MRSADRLHAHLFWHRPRATKRTRRRAQRRRCVHRPCSTHRTALRCGGPNHLRLSSTILFPDSRTLPFFLDSYTHPYSGCGCGSAGGAAEAGGQRGLQGQGVRACSRSVPQVGRPLESFSALASSSLLFLFLSYLFLCSSLSSFLVLPRMTEIGEERREERRAEKRMRQSVLHTYLSMPPLTCCTAGQRAGRGGPSRGGRSGHRQDRHGWSVWPQTSSTQAGTADTDALRCNTPSLPAVKQPLQGGEAPNRSGHGSRV